MLIQTTVLLVLFGCLQPSLQQGSPPGVPPVHTQEQIKVYPDGHGPPEANAHQRGFAGTHDAEHIKEHLKEVVEKPKEEMTEEELEFHYFKLHDYDNNNKLDGTEITKAITHFHGDQENDKKEDKEENNKKDNKKANKKDNKKGNKNKNKKQPMADDDKHKEEEKKDEEEGKESEPPKHEAKVFSDDEIINIVDMVLKEDDLNGDGYIEYVEFVTAQRKARGDQGAK